jgi:hypothetical protein
MNDGDIYRERAEEARQMSVKAISPLDQATWLRIAEDWLKLAADADKREGGYRAWRHDAGTGREQSPQFLRTCCSDVYVTFCRILPRRLFIPMQKALIS